MDVTDPWTASELRLNATEKIHDWLNYPDTSDHLLEAYNILKECLGRSRDQPFTHVSFTEEEHYICKLLVGPHGRSIFRMLCVKHGLTHFHKS